MTASDMQRMPREAKLKLMLALWEDLAREGDALESPAWHQEALRETEQRVRLGTERTWDWNEAMAEPRRRARRG